ncbi:uncharacterized protein [Rutidosis leptorrhynchoides]|uniref:uncharacterized protein n=1 Tax=Rutidosis leptorrhynchoides TaxID=125765 RepID=UPI003A9A61DA
MNINPKDNETMIPVNQNQIQIPRHQMDSDSAFIGSWSSSSSSSFLTTSFGSELDDSNDSDPNNDEDDEFIAQLTRQLADYMLEDNEVPSFKHSGFQNPKFQKPNQIHKQTRRSYADTVKKSIVGFQSEQTFTGDKQPQPPIQLYQLENQPRVESGGWGRKDKMTESTQYVKYQLPNRGVNNGGKKGYGSSNVVGSGMRAIFLRGSGTRNVTSGTGVFLPRSATDATDHSRKKSGCSTVLVPTRVLEALEQHFNNMESLSPSNTLPQAPHINHQVKGKTQSHESVSAVDHQDSKLPQEWIY